MSSYDVSRNLCTFLDIAAARGKVTLFNPPPFLFCRFSRPPWPSAMLLAIVKPRPRPTGLATARAEAIKGIEHSLEFRCNAKPFVLNSDLKPFIVVVDLDQG